MCELVVSLLQAQMRVPELFKAYSIAFISLLAGAAVVHNIYTPDLVSGALCGHRVPLLL